METETEKAPIQLKLKYTIVETITENKNKQFFIQTAISTALKSEFLNFKHGAVLVKGNEIICTAYNVNYGKLVNHGQWSLHAEAGVILKMKEQKIVDLSNYILYVVRVNKNGELRNSKPCKNCEKICIKFNVGRVYYSC